MFWIHGGSFLIGSSNDYDGDSLFGVPDKEVIVVTINYRLGILGFFVSGKLFH
jgi:para-nitrobenzyl esterase